MILGIRTDKPEAEIYLYSSTGDFIAEKFWQADRQLARFLLAELENFLQENDVNFKDLTGLLAYAGPGSFTGLRIGLTVINTIAYSENLPLAGASGEDWREKAVERLKKGENDKAVMPIYNAPAHITKPKK